MDAHAQDAYYQTQILTAPPQRLQLLLLDGALRFGQQAAEQWEANQNEAAYESLVRCRRIVTELIAAVKPSAEALPGRVRSVYVFIFRTLTEAHLEQNLHKLRDALAILEIERETWRQVCEELSTTPHAAAPPPAPNATDDLPEPGLSLQA